MSLLCRSPKGLSDDSAGETRHGNEWQQCRRDKAWKWVTIGSLYSDGHWMKLHCAIDFNLKELTKTQPHCFPAPLGAPISPQHRTHLRKAIATQSSQLYPATRLFAYCLSLPKTFWFTLFLPFPGWVYKQAHPLQMELCTAAYWWLLRLANWVGKCEPMERLNWGGLSETHLVCINVYWLLFTV